MDTTTIIIIALFACIVVAGVLVYRAKGEVGFELPFVKFSMKGKNKSEPPVQGVKIEDSRGRHFRLHDETGQPTEITGGRFRGDIEIKKPSPKE